MIFCVYRLQRVAALVSEARTAIESNDEAPLMEANTPSELALLVKHYRLLQASVCNCSRANVQPGVQLFFLLPMSTFCGFPPQFVA